MIINSLGRQIPNEINGYKKVVPCHAKFSMEKVPDMTGNSKSNAPPVENKLLPDIKEAIRQCGLCDGMTISFHHHFRNGDRVANMVLAAISELGIKELKVAISSIFPIHAPLVKHIKEKTVSQLSCNYMLGPVAEAMCQGQFPSPVIFRTHGGRDRAIAAGEEKN